MDDVLQEKLKKKYDAGFTTNVESVTLPPGLDENIVTYLSNPVSTVAEHIDYITPIEKELEKLSAAKGKLVSLKAIKFKLDG